MQRRSAMHSEPTQSVRRWRHDWPQDPLPDQACSANSSSKSQVLPLRLFPQQVLAGLNRIFSFFFNISVIFIILFTSLPSIRLDSGKKSAKKHSLELFQLTITTSLPREKQDIEFWSKNDDKKCELNWIYDVEIHKPPNQKVRNPDTQLFMDSFKDRINFKCLKN